MAFISLGCGHPIYVAKYDIHANVSTKYYSVSNSYPKVQGTVTTSEYGQ